MDERKLIARERVESLNTYFGVGVKENKEGDPIFFRKVGKDTPKPESKVFVSLYIAGDREKDIDSNFKDFIITLEQGKKFKEAGVNLSKPVKEPLKLRYSIWEYVNKNGEKSVFREISNVAHKVEGEWCWIIKAEAKPEAKEEAPKKTSKKKIVVDDDMLPF